MPGNREENNFNDRFNDVQNINKFRGDSEVNQRNEGMADAHRYTGSSLTSKNSAISHPINNIKTKINEKSSSNSSNSTNSSNRSIDVKNGSSNSLIGKNRLENPNKGLSFKQKLTKKGIQSAATVINPALGKALQSKRGSMMLNQALQKKGSFMGTALGIGTGIPSLLGDSDKKEEEASGKQDENRLENTTITISKKVKKILIPVGISCALVVFVCCILLAAAQTYISILGIDLSSSITMEDAEIDKMLSDNQTILEENHVIDEITNTNGSSGSNSSGTNSSGTKNSSGSSNVKVGEAAKIEGEQARIDWLYDGNGVPTTKEENDKYLETFEVEYLDENGNRQTMEITMHKKLKTEVQAIFKEMADAGFKVIGGNISYRTWGSDYGYAGNFYHSAHTYGHAFDVNPDQNYYVGSYVVGSYYLPGTDPYSVTEEIVNIWKKHGFYWGGDWTYPKDYMHFSYFNH